MILFVKNNDPPKLPDDRYFWLLPTVVIVCGVLLTALFQIIGILVMPPALNPHQLLFLPF
jgi:hypothetical protein